MLKNFHPNLILTYSIPAITCLWNDVVLKCGFTFRCCSMLMAVTSSNYLSVFSFCVLLIRIIRILVWFPPVAFHHSRVLAVEVEVEEVSKFVCTNTLRYLCFVE